MAPSFEPSPLPGERRTGTVAALRAVPSDTKHIHLTTNSFQVTRDLPPPPPPPSQGGGGVAGVRSEPTIRLNTNTMRGWQE